MTFPTFKKISFKVPDDSMCPNCEHLYDGTFCKIFNKKVEIIAVWICAATGYDYHPTRLEECFTLESYMGSLGEEETSE